ncbi:MAG: DUF1540 domain-containing protein [Clostridia bacterium]|nr:DUF1540 domain-containing protein [Clostridia bacterium]
MEKRTGYQKIKCNVSDCTHNRLEDSTCRLETIQVCPCGSKTTTDPLKDTACASYEYAHLQRSERYD